MIDWTTTNDYFNATYAPLYLDTNICVIPSVEDLSSTLTLYTNGTNMELTNE